VLSWDEDDYTDNNQILVSLLDPNSDIFTPGRCPCVLCVCAYSRAGCLCRLQLGVWVRLRYPGGREGCRDTTCACVLVSLHMSTRLSPIFPPLLCVCALAGSKDNNPYTHYSLLATVEQNWGLPNLGRNDATASVYQFN
jgi:hypothetical protein